jgi:hypothetical protein
VRKVAEKFDAVGQPVDCSIIAEWERDGWSGTSVAEVTPPEPKKAEPTEAEPEKAEAEKAESMQVEVMMLPGRRSYAQRAEDVLLKTITVAEAVLDRIHEIATAVSSDSAAAGEDTRSAPLLKAADSIAKLMKSLSEAANLAIEGLERIPALPIDDAAARGAPDEQSTCADGNYPLRSSMEAYDRELKKIRDSKS